MTSSAPKAAQVRAALGQAGCDNFTIHYFGAVDSTNAWLLRHPDLPTASVCWADEQTAGRGRGGAKWHTPADSAIALSLAWDFPALPQPALTLAVGVAIIRALPESPLQLKWPNDILMNNHKVGGILIETQGSRAVIGVGLNLNLPATQPIDQPWANLPRADDPDRTRMVAGLIQHLGAACTRFAEAGFAPFADEWQAHHAWHGREVEVLEPKPWRGCIQGLRTDGALLINAAGKQCALTQAVRLRLAESR